MSLIYRVKLGETIEYYSNSGQTWMETEIAQVRPNPEAIEFQISAKRGTWLTGAHKNIRYGSHEKPVPDSPAPEPSLKKQDVGTRPMSFDMTPGASAPAA